MDSQDKAKLESIGFYPLDGSMGIYESNGIKINLKTLDIFWPNKITVSDKTTSSLKKDETWVVLQCVNHLLSIGYQPESIILEKNYPLGTSNKGKLDILILDTQKKSYAMIECKTSTAFSKTWESMCKDSDKADRQLISYFQQDKIVQLLILYTYDYTKNEAESHIIKVTPSMQETKNAKECFVEWGNDSYPHMFFLEKTL